MSNIQNMINKLIDAVKNTGDKTSAYDTSAEVKRIEGDTAWVHIPGGVDETPVKLTINASEGDTVQVRVNGGRAWLQGNATAPPTDDTTANVARTIATDAQEEAVRAGKAADAAEAEAVRAGAAADRAENKADDAQASAESAQASADSALVSLATVEDVAGVLEWITNHGAMTLTSDVTVNPSHVYFVVDAGGDYVVGSTHYSIVSEPKDSELSTYYELSVDKSIQNYVATHVVVNSEGLWLIPDSNGSPTSNGKKILIATGAGSSYTSAGTYIIDRSSGTDHVYAKFLSDGATMTSGDGTQIAHLGYGDTYGELGTTDAPYYTLGTRLNTASPYSTTATYAYPDLCTYNNKLWICIRNTGYTPGNWNASDWAEAIGAYSTTEGEDTFAHGVCSHAEGNETQAVANESHAEGYRCKAVGSQSHAEGNQNVANGEHSHAEGEYNTMSRSAQASHVEGGYNEVTASWSHAEGARNVASGEHSHVEGYYNVASGKRSHAGGNYTIAKGQDQTAIGRYNVQDDSNTYALIIGNGSTSQGRKNGFTVDWSGNVNVASGARYKINGTALTAADVSAVALSDKYTRSSTGDLAWTSTTEGDAKVISKSALAFWSGAYSGTSSNLSRCSTGAIIGSNGGAMAGQLLTSFKNAVAMGSYGASAGTVPDLCTELRYSSGAMGSASISTAYTLNGVTVPTGWYNFLWIPHRSGGVNGQASGDNCNYGNLFLFGMNNTNGRYIVRFSSSIKEVAKIPVVGGWTLAGTATGTATVTIPEDGATEVMVKVNPTGTSVYSSTILRSDLQSIWYVGGYYYSSTDYGIVNINVSNSNKTFQLRNVRNGGSDVKSSSKLTVYYR